MTDFLQGSLCDVTLVVQGKRLAAHRAVLAAASHVFRLMFTSKDNTKEHTLILCLEALLQNCLQRNIRGASLRLSKIEKEPCEPKCKYLVKTKMK